MKRINLVLFIGILIGIVVWAIFISQKNDLGEENSKKTFNGKDSKKKENLKRPDTVRGKRTVFNNDLISFDNIDLKKELTFAREEMLKRDDECNHAIIEFFDQGLNKFETIDQLSEEEVINSLKFVFDKTLRREAQEKVFQKLLVSLEMYPKIDPYGINNLIRSNRICRNGKSLGYINQVLDWAHKKKWDNDNEYKLKLKKLLLQGLIDIMGDEFTTENLSYTIAKLQKMANQNMFEIISPDDINEIKVKILEQFSIYKKALSQTEEKRDSFKMVLLDHFKINQSLAMEMRELVSREIPEFP